MTDSNLFMNSFILYTFTLFRLNKEEKCVWGFMQLSFSFSHCFKTENQNQNPIFVTFIDPTTENFEKQFEPFETHLNWTRDSLALD